MFTCDWDVARAPRLSGWAQGLLGMGRSADLTPVAEYLGAQAWLSAMCVGELAFEPRLSQDLTHCHSSLPRVAVTTALVPTRAVDGSMYLMRARSCAMRLYIYLVNVAEQTCNPVSAGSIPFCLVR